MKKKIIQKIKNQSGKPMSITDKQSLAEINFILDLYNKNNNKWTNPFDLANGIENAKQAQKTPIGKIYDKIVKKYDKEVEKIPSLTEISQFANYIAQRGISNDEAWFCPEDFYYEGVLSQITKEDVIFDLGCGDLRLDLILSQIAKKVYAVEIDPILIANSLKIIGYDLPSNLIVMVGNAFEIEIPSDTNLILSLMIKRAHDFTPEMKKRRILSATYNRLELILPD